jgi:hypothetical protein
VIEVRDAAFYRQRAAQMRMQADSAATDELRASYLAIAADWERLAEQIEDITRNPSHKKSQGKGGTPIQT